MKVLPFGATRHLYSALGRTQNTRGKRVIPQGEDLALSWKLEKWKDFSMCLKGEAERGGQNDSEDMQEEKKLGGGYKEEAGVGQ